jgi:hypothetical protein
LAYIGRDRRTLFPVIHRTLSHSVWF